MSEPESRNDKAIENLMKDLRREIRRTRDLAGRATVMAGMGLILSMLIFAVVLFGMDGLRDNLKILSTATSEDIQDAGATALEDGNLGLEEVQRLTGNLPEVHIEEWSQVLED